MSSSWLILGMFPSIVFHVVEDDDTSLDLSSGLPCPFLVSVPFRQVVDTCLRKVLIDRDVQGAILYSKQARTVWH